MDDDIIEKFAEFFPEMYNDIVSYTTGKNFAYIFLKDGRTIKFELLNYGFILNTI